jgi:hypothetical protein
MTFAWYCEISSSNVIEQGDMIPDCPIILPPEELLLDEVQKVDAKLIDSIVMSQSCDLENNKIQIVLVCPYFSLKTFVDNLPYSSHKQIRKTIDNLKKGFLPGYHLLNKFEVENAFSDYFVVDFRNVYGIHIDSLRKIAKSIESR